MYTGQPYQTTGTATHYTTTEQYNYQYQMPTTTQTTTTTTQYTTQPVTTTYTTQPVTTTYTTQPVTSTYTTQPVTTTYTTQQQYSIPEYTQPNYTVPGTVTTTTTASVPGMPQGIGMGPLKPQPAFKLLRQGSGISPNEQKGIVSTAMLVYQYDINPISNNTASRIKKTLGGDWLVIVYNQGKPIDFNMTCVQGNDYMYFTLNDMAYQVCRLR